MAVIRTRFPQGIAIVLIINDGCPTNEATPTCIVSVKKNDCTPLPFRQFLPASCTSAQTQPDPSHNPNPNPLGGSRSARVVPRLRRVFRRLFPKNNRPAERQASTHRAKGVQCSVIFSHTDDAKIGTVYERAGLTATTKPYSSVFRLTLMGDETRKQNCHVLLFFAWPRSVYRVSSLQYIMVFRECRGFVGVGRSLEGERDAEPPPKKGVGFLRRISIYDPRACQSAGASRQGPTAGTAM